MPLPLSPAFSLARRTLLTALPDGGQLTARRNAWASMSADAARARARRDAAAAMDAAVLAAAQAAAHPRAARG